MIINLTDVGKEKLNDLAAKAVLNGLLVEYAGKVRRVADNGTRYTAYHFMTTSRSVKERIYNVYLWKSVGDGVWFGDCSPDAEDREACIAARVGGKCCSHIAVSVAELKEMQAKFEAARVVLVAVKSEYNADELEKIRQEVMEG